MVIRFPILMGDTMLGASQVAAICRLREDAQKEGRELIFAMVFPINVTEQDVVDLETIGIEIFKPFYEEVAAVSIPRYYVGGITIKDEVI